MPFQIIRNDITKVAADAIVNTANPKPVYGSGTDQAIYQAAGAEKLLAERKIIGEIHPGEAGVTAAFGLHARYIIHTVGPVWQDGRHGEFDILASCYRKSLLLARQLDCRSIAFPLISTGVYGFPKDKALKTALSVIRSFLDEEEMEITLVVFSKEAFEISASLMTDVRQYIDDRYVEGKTQAEYGSAEDAGRDRRRRLESETSADLYQTGELPDLGDFVFSQRPSQSTGGRPKGSFKSRLQDVMKHMGESFQERLLRLIDERGLTDAQVYKKANLDRKLFSKIRCNPAYVPKKRTVVALAMALELNLDETVDLLRRAGLAFSPSSRFDLIVEYCIENGIYDIFEVNALLFEFNEQLLGC